MTAASASTRRSKKVGTFGLRNQGMHSGPPCCGADAPPVQTTLLIDRGGTVLWIDRSEN